MARPQLRDPWQDVRDTLRARILNGTYKPGERLLEVPLAEEFGLSRGPIREALQSLTPEGLIVRMPRLGSIVVPIDARTADEVYSLRIVLECFAVERAMARDFDLAHRLRLHVERMGSALEREDWAAVLDADLDFHGAFVEAADHERLRDTWRSLVGPLRIMLALTVRRAPDYLRRTHLGHEEILERAAAGDVPETVAMMRKHLDRAYAMVQGYLRETHRADA